METVNIKINGVQYAVEKGSTVLEAARAAKIDIPTLCYLKDINEIGACRLCLVEVSEGGRPFRLVTACVFPVSEGMEVLTNTPRINKSRLLLQTTGGKGQTSRVHDEDELSFLSENIGRCICLSEGSE